MVIGYRLCTLALWAVLTGSSIARAVTGEDLAARTKVAAVGQFAPQAVLDTIDGRSVDLGEFYGRRPVYLKFWATWCVPCREQMPHFEHAQQQYGKDVAVFAVNLGLNDDVSDVRQFLDQVHLSMPVAIDSAGELAATFGVVVTPLHVLIDADGRVIYVGHEANRELDAALDRIAHSTPHANAGRAPMHREQKQHPVAVGDRAPAIVGATGLQQPSVIAFVMSWCESYLKVSRPAVSTSCQKSRESISKSFAATSAKARWIAVAGRVWSTQQDVDAYRAKYDVPYPVLLDESGEMFRRYGIRQVPTVLIVDAGGIVRDRFEGYSTALDAALGRVARQNP